MRGLDFSSWQGLLVTLVGLTLFTLISIGIRLMMMMTIQQRRERMNRQINERLRTLIAAYKVLGGSFTGTLTVDPRHLRQLRRPDRPTEEVIPQMITSAENEHDHQNDVTLADLGFGEGSDRPRRIRDAVEAALADIILLGTEQQIRLAEKAAQDLVAGHPVHTHELVVSLRDFIREALDLSPIPAGLDIPMQGPTRPTGTGPRGKGEGGGKGKGVGSGGGGMGGGGAGGTGMETTNPGDPSTTEQSS